MNLQEKAAVPRFESFEAFFPYYLQEHSDPRGRALHYLGTTAATAGLVAILVFGAWAWLPLLLVAGYGPAWIAHFFIEKNRPATFTYPLWSLRGDYRMFWLWLTGRLEPALQAAGAVRG